MPRNAEEILKEDLTEEEKTFVEKMLALVETDFKGKEARFYGIEKSLRCAFVEPMVKKHD